MPLEAAFVLQRGQMSSTTWLLQGAAGMEKALNVSKKVKSKVRNREANIPM